MKFLLSFFLSFRIKKYVKDASSEIGFEAGMKDLLCFVLVVVFFGGLSSVLPSSQGFGVLLCFLE